MKAPPVLRAAPKRYNSGAPFVPHGSSASGAVRPAAPLPEDRPEKKVARNGVAYTKKSFVAFYGRGHRTEQEWAALQRPVRAGPVNALTGRVMPKAERIVQEMYEWYAARVREPLDEVFRNLHNALFKRVKGPLKEDLWKHPDLGGASQPAAPLAVTREHVARQVETVIKYRENGWMTKASQ